MIYLFFILLLLLLILPLYMTFKAHHDTVDYQTIRSEKVDKPFRLFFISDIHRRTIKNETLMKIRDTIDIVIIGGDLREKGVPLERTRENIHKLKQWGAPLFFVWGNNDYDSIPDQLYELLVSEDVTILANSFRDITVGNNTVSLIGLDCCYHKEAQFDAAVKGSAGEYKILITHAPVAFYEMDEIDQRKVDLVLAGHTHGGQIRIFGLGFYRRGGLEKIHNTKVLVSEGYGYTRLPFRLGTNAECQVITFK